MQRMEHSLDFYIGGAWVAPNDPRPCDVINPATEQPVGRIMLGNSQDVNAAVAAARAAFRTFSRTSREERIALHRDEEDAIAIANDTVYGLSSYVSGSDLARAQRVAERIRAGMVHVNDAGLDFSAPFGGYKQSGNGREWGELGLEDFLEVKAVMNPPAA